MTWTVGGVSDAEFARTGEPASASETPPTTQVLLGLALVLLASLSTAEAADAWIRVNQIGYLPGDPKIAVTPMNDAVLSQPSPLHRQVLAPVEAITSQMWPGVPAIPGMSTGATDGLYLRNAGIPTYGVSGIFSDADDARQHGKDERIGIKQFNEAREFLYRLVKAYAS